MSAAPLLHGVLFDLDGTLLDTAPDMAHALNLLRAEHGEPPIPFGHIRPHVSHGALALVRLGFPQADEQRVAALRSRILELYSANLALQTTLFPGFEEVLQQLESRSLRWGIVTNKPGFLTEPLLATLRLAERAACIVSGDTLAQRKPHPAPLLHAAALLGLDPGDCVYVGDAERDVRAAHAAGMRAVVALFGYLGEDDRPHSWNADGMIEQPGELIGWLNGPGGNS
ncbi:MAG TPA: phosphoglycolate phosphatase [Steroidobacteraceae bacterium]|nr:phosphoglycolate phosphatase [Steroidobacteraceae bacterium]